VEEPHRLTDLREQADGARPVSPMALLAVHPCQKIADFKEIRLVEFSS